MVARDAYPQRAEGERSGTQDVRRQTAEEPPPRKKRLSVTLIHQ
jgi:hypothetical protein